MCVHRDFFAVKTMLYLLVKTSYQEAASLNCCQAFEIESEEVTYCLFFAICLYAAQAPILTHLLISTDSFDL